MKRHEKPAKRVYADGTVKWIARYTAADGRRPSAGTFTRRRDAQDAIDAAYEVEQPAKRDTVAAYAEHWIRRYPRSERTNRVNASRLRTVSKLKIERKPLGDWFLAELRRRHAVELVDVMLRQEGRAPSGAGNVLRVLSAMCEDAITDEYMVGNPFKGVRVRENDPRAQKHAREHRIWTFEQMHAFAGHAGAFEPMVRMLADTGLRVGELLALRRDEQDLRGGTFRVSGTAYEGRVVASSREKRHDRVGPIPPGCLELLRAMPVRIDSPWLFPTPGSRRVGKVGRDIPGGLLWRLENFRRQVWKPTQNSAGFAPTPKEFRESFNTHLLAAGVDRADLADMLGHSVDVNADRYTQALRRSGDQVRGLIG